MLIKIKTFIEKVNIPKKIATHLVGKQHGINHRMGIGFIIMLIGMIIGGQLEAASKFIEWLRFPARAIDALLEAIGAIPIGEHLVNLTNQNIKENENQLQPG